jgi:hypothetical protein
MCWEQYHERTTFLIGAAASGSIGFPLDVARAVSFFTHPDYTFLNGCVLQLGGGIHCRLHDPC